MTVPAPHDTLNQDLHHPVLLTEVLGALDPRVGEIYVDCTFGVGGYSQRILESGDCRVFGIDRDPYAIERGQALQAYFPGHLTLLKGCFSEMEALLAGEGISSVDGIVLDLGISSTQIDDAARGFSFRVDGPLDMRMSAEGRSAADVVNEATLDDLVKIIREFGEERYARRIAQAIVGSRDNAPITRTLALANLITSALPKSRRSLKRGTERIHPATRTFQALRIYVNDEIGELRRGLAAAERLLDEDGRLVIVSFHSLEDREVKRFLRLCSGNAPRAHRHSPMTKDAERAPSFEMLHRGAIKPIDAEKNSNPRARSARMRGGKRTAAPAWPHGPLENAA